MRGRKSGSAGGGILAAILIGAGIWVLQDIVKDETESILKRERALAELEQWAGGDTSPARLQWAVETSTSPM